MEDTQITLVQDSFKKVAPIAAQPQRFSMLACSRSHRT